MRNFWQGLLWGSLIVIIIGTVINPIMSKSQRKKPLVERSADAFLSTTHGVIRQARKRLMHRFN
jgi:uncharacterized membrane protein YagU involved in acid resistance